MIWWILWYGVGLVGSLLARAAFRSGFRANNYSLDPVTVKTILLIALCSLLGPITVIASGLWWICAFLEHHPIWTWRWVQPIKRILNHKMPRGTQIVAALTLMGIGLTWMGFSIAHVYPIATEFAPFIIWAGGIVGGSGIGYSLR